MINGKTITLTLEDKNDLREKISSFSNLAEFCRVNKIHPTLLKYPMDFGRCSQKTYNRISKLKSNKENGAS